MPEVQNFSTELCGLYDFTLTSPSVELESSLLRLERAALQAQYLGWRAAELPSFVDLVPAEDVALEASSERLLSISAAGRDVAAPAAA